MWGTNRMGRMVRVRHGPPAIHFKRFVSEAHRIAMRIFMKQSMTLFSVMLLSATLGFAGAFIEGFIASRSIQTGQALMGLSAGFVGLCVGPGLGAIAYALIFRRHVTIPQFALVGFISILIGSIVALLVAPPGWAAGGCTVVAAVTTSFIVASFSRTHDNANGD